ncbi:hypothetical protein C7U89_00495 [Bradyrhizobium sp. WBOS4]|nr:hypothetical protein [Bradyrhizobium sp. WBOS8]MDD1581435.1 hypothetical protein [Bradyrhizobium sp. WBOS4]UUO49724.1 hypothetical protein DCM78_24120 [Bradyrhizobium sp. WBOS04]UUO58489.1 hypothetical protein DCM80_04395 [Bradyrhizobium sp. WBOS08]
MGSTALDSGDVVVSAGTPVTVCLKDAAGPSVGDLASVEILLKDDAGQYFKVDDLNANKPALMIVAPGTYRFSRRAGTSCGVFSG